MISFVVCSVDAAKYAAATRSLASAMAGAAHELVGIHDARSLGEGWTRGLERARGDPVVFCHDDIAVHAPALGARLTRHLERSDIVGVAGTRRCVGMDWAEAGTENAEGAVVEDRGDGPHFCFYGADTDGHDGVPGLQSLDGVFLAMRRDAVEAVRFDGDTFDGWHGYDADFTFRAHRAGWRLRVALDLPIVHHSRNRPDAARMRYHLRFADKHRDALGTGRGPWIDERTPIAVPDGLAAAFGRDALARRHARTRDAVRGRREAAERPYAASRNDPCPCGNGLRYRECHGRRP